MRVLLIMRLLTAGFCCLAAGPSLAQGAIRDRQPIPVFPQRTTPARPPEIRNNPNSTEAYTIALEAQEYAQRVSTSTLANDPNLSVAINNAEHAIGLARRALLLDNSVALAFDVLGLAERQTWHWKPALEALEQAYYLDPTDASIVSNYAWTLSFVGDHDRALRIAQEAVNRNATSANAHRDLGIAFAYAGNIRGASAAFRQCIGANPTIGVCHIYLGCMQLRMRNFAEAEASLREAERLFGEEMLPAAASSLAHAFAMTGLRADARRLFDRLTAMQGERVVGAGTWPLAYLAIGDEESAYARLERAVSKVESHEPDEGFFNLMIIKHNVQASPVLEQTRFRALRERIGVMGETQ
jgi:tetratricopeptide (TPR) repeat protein